MNSRVVAVLLGASLALSSPPPVLAGHDVPVVYEPARGAGIARIYVNGQPIALFADSAVSMAAAADFVQIASKPYMRVWVSLRNNSEEMLELVPQDAFTMMFLDELYLPVDAEYPVPPSAILSRIDQAASDAHAGVLIAGLASRIAAALTTTDTRASYSFRDLGSAIAGSGSATIHDGDEKLQAKFQDIGQQERRRLESLEQMSSDAKSQVGNACLRRNSIGSSDTVSGYVYFALPRSSKQTGTWKQGESACSMIVRLAARPEVKVVYSPNYGE